MGSESEGGDGSLFSGSKALDDGLRESVASEGGAGEAGDAVADEDFEIQGSGLTLKLH